MGCKFLVVVGKWIYSVPGELNQHLLSRAFMTKAVYLAQHEKVDSIYKTHSLQYFLA
jgi:hypothetical protein